MAAVSQPASTLQTAQLPPTLLWTMSCSSAWKAVVLRHLRDT